MALSKPQIWRLKAAQRQAGIDDVEYRETLGCLFGISTSKDTRFGNDAWDTLMSYFEAIYWRGVDSGVLKPPCRPSEPFQQRGYWAAKNPSENTSRDRFDMSKVQDEISNLELQLGTLGCSSAYLAAIRRTITQSHETSSSLRHYAAALKRTIKARLSKSMECPF